MWRGVKGHNILCNNDLRLKNTAIIIFQAIANAMYEDVFPVIPVLRENGV